MSNLSSISSSQYVYRLPPYRLKPLTQYTVSVIVSLPWTSRQSIKYTIASSEIYVTTGQVVAVIDGGDSRQLLLGSSMTLDASHSFDESLSPPSLQYSITCVQKYPVFGSGCLIMFDRSIVIPGQFSVSTISSTAASTVNVVTVKVADTRDPSRVGYATVEITVVPTGIQDLILSVQDQGPSSINPSTPLVVVGTMVYNQLTYSMVRNQNLTLDIFENGVPLTPNRTRTAIALSPLTYHLSPTVYAAGSGSSPQQFRFHFVLDSAVLSYRNAYRLRLRLSTTMTTTLSIQVNQPPQPGTISVQPMSGYEQETTFTCNVGGWEDHDLPLTYSFGVGRAVADGGSASAAVSASSSSPASSL